MNREFLNDAIVCSVLVILSRGGQLVPDITIAHSTVSAKAAIDAIAASAPDGILCAYASAFAPCVGRNGERVKKYALGGYRTDGAIFKVGDILSDARIAEKGMAAARLAGLID